VADSKRLTVLKAICTHLATEVTVVNGYKHTLTDKVFRGRMFVTNNDPVPMVSILENIDPDRYPRRAGGENEHAKTAEDWILLVQGWAENDAENPTDPAYELMADVRKALAKIIKRRAPDEPGPENPNYRLGGLIAGMTMEPGIARPPLEQVSAKAFFWMRVSIKFVEDPNDPYNLS
jgi:hypothetical protein